MSPNESPNLSVSRYLRTVWGLKTWIALTTLILVLLAWGYSLYLPNRYQSVAQVVFLPSLLSVGPRPEQRTVSQDTLAQLLRTAETARRVHERVRSDRAAAMQTPEAEPGATAAPALMPPALMPGEIEALKGCSDEEIRTLSAGAISSGLGAEVSIEQRMPTEILYSPILRVRCVMANPRLARVVANAAARVLVDLYAELVQGHAARSYESMNRAIEDRRKAMEAIDKESADLRESQGDPDLLRREIDLLRRSLERGPTTGTADPVQSEALRQKLLESQNRLSRIEDRLDTLRLDRDTNLATLSNLRYTQDGVAYAPSVHLSELRMASPAGPGAARIYPNRGRIAAMAGIAGLVLWLAGAFLLLFVEPSASETLPAPGPGPSGPRPWPRHPRGGHSRSRQQNAPRREPEPHRSGGEGPAADSPRQPNGGRSSSSGPSGVTTVRPE